MAVLASPVRGTAPNKPLHNEASCVVAGGTIVTVNIPVDTKVPMSIVGFYATGGSSGGGGGGTRSFGFAS